MKDEKYMKDAIAEARKALAEDEIPIGAVVVNKGEIIGRGHNCRKNCSEPFGHAEIAAVKEAAQRLGTWRFDDCVIYVTLEPCVMCAGMLVQARMGRIVFGARDPKAGGCRSLYEITSDPRMYHKCEITEGVCETEAAEILRQFFINRREKQKTQKSK